MNAREEYDLIRNSDIRKRTDAELYDLHGRLVEDGSHDGIFFCGCAIQKELFQRWYLEFSKGDIVSQGRVAALEELLRLVLLNELAEGELEGRIQFAIMPEEGMCARCGIPVIRGDHIDTPIGDVCTDCHSDLTKVFEAKDKVTEPPPIEGALPCPFRLCESGTKSLEFKRNRTETQCRVECAWCGTYGPPSKTEKGAIESWNHEIRDEDLKTASVSDSFKALNFANWRREYLKTASVSESFRKSDTVRTALECAFNAGRKSND